MLNITKLSHAALFLKPERNNWAETPEEWQSVYPLVDELSVEELLLFFPAFKTLGEVELRKYLADTISSRAEIFEPEENYFFQLPNLEHSLEQAQTILYKAQSPCKVGAFIEEPVITCCGDVWLMSDMISRAFLLLGYIPPFVLQEPYPVNSQAQNVAEKCSHFIHRKISALLYEHRTLSELVR